MGNIISHNHISFKDQMTIEQGQYIIENIKVILKNNAKYKKLIKNNLFVI